MESFTAGFQSGANLWDQLVLRRQQQQALQRQQQQMAMLQKRYEQEQARQEREDQLAKIDKFTSKLLQANEPETVDALVDAYAPVLGLPIPTLLKFKSAGQAFARSQQKKQLDEIAKTAGLEGRPFSMTEPTRPGVLPMQLPAPGYSKGMVGETPYWLGLTPLEQSYVGYNRQQAQSGAQSGTKLQRTMKDQNGRWWGVDYNGVVVDLKLQGEPLLKTFMNVQGDEEPYMWINGEWVPTTRREASPQPPAPEGNTIDFSTWK